MRVVQVSLADIRGEAAAPFPDEPLLGQDHDYDIIIPDTKGVSGLTFFAGFDTKPSSITQQGVVELNPGDPLPVRDPQGNPRPVWVSAWFMGRDEIEDHASATDFDVVFWCPSRSQLPAYPGHGRVRHGDVLHRLSGTDATFITGEYTELWNDADHMHHQGVPMFIVGDIRVTAVDNAAGKGAPPALYIVQDEGTEAILFPAAGAPCRFCIPLASRPRGYSPTPPSIVIANPSNGNECSAAWALEIRAGYAPRSIQYSIYGTLTASSINDWRTPQYMTLTGGRFEGVNNNAATAGDWTVHTDWVIPGGVAGGAAKLINFATNTITPGTSVTKSTYIAWRHVQMRGYFSTAPTDGTVHYSMTNH